MPDALRATLAPLLLAGLALLPGAAAQTDAPLSLRDGDRIALVGNALAERMQHHGWLETRLRLRHPTLELHVRNLGFSADTLTVAQRTAGFGTRDEWLERVGASVVVACFGYVESFDGDAGLDAFRADLGAWVDHVTSTAFDGREPPRLVLVTPVPVEDLGDPLLPDPDAGNARLAGYVEVMREVAAGRGVPLVDLFAALPSRYLAEGPLTIDGVHLDVRGDAVVAGLIEAALFGPAPSASDASRVEAVRGLVLEKNLVWFNRYRATDGYNVYGGRSSLTYDGVTNYDVLQRELEVLDATAEVLDARIDALLRDLERPPREVVVPELLTVTTNRPGDGPDGEHLYLSGEEALAEMTPAPGMQVSLFADESRFPEIANPVQMAFDTRGRLWVAAWPTYPHWKPGEPMNDRLVTLHDDDGDGRADRSTIFAGDLHNPTGFEFWDGGVLVANCPDLLFLKDTDGDGVADVRERILHGLSSADTHHSANSFVIGPDGALYFQEGTFHMSQVESVYGPVRSVNACAWRYEPRTRRVERYIPYGFANPHGHAFDRWGQDFITDGTGNQNYYALPFSGHLEQPDKHRGYFTFFDQRSRPSAATEILSSPIFPEADQGHYLVANVIGFRGIFKYALRDDGSGFAADEVDPLVSSRDPNFRPVDMEVGPDGALWFVDWHTPLIGHMQHHLRDPSRDHAHGRVYRVTPVGSSPATPPPIADRPVDELVALLADPTDRVRYRARLELSARDGQEVVEAARAWAARRGELPSDGSEADVDAREHDLLEALWLQQQHAVLDRPLLRRMLRSPTDEARAAAVRVLRQMRHQEPELLELLREAVDDPAPRVRLEAVVACSFVPDARAAEVALRALSHPTDRFLEYALQETVRALEPQWRGALASGEPFAVDDPAGLAYALSRLDTDELRRVRPSTPLAREMLTRHGLTSSDFDHAARFLAAANGTTPDQELLDAVERADLRSDGHADHLLVGLFATLPALREERPAQVSPSQRGPADAVPVPRRLRDLAVDGRRVATRRLATAARIDADGSIEPAWSAAMESLGALHDLLDAAPRVGDPALRAALFPRVLALLDEPPAPLADRLAGSSGTRGRYLRVELPGDDRLITLAEVEVLSAGRNVALGKPASQSSTNWGGVASRGVDGITSGVYADGGQTHTVEGGSDPWWEVDLQGSFDVDEVRVYTRTESGGAYLSRLEGFRLRVLDDQRRTVYESGPHAAPQTVSSFELAAPRTHMRRRAVLCLAALGVSRDEAAAALVARLGDPELHATIVSALTSLPVEDWRPDTVALLGDALLAGFSGAAADAYDDAAGRQVLALADLVAPHLDDAAAGRLRDLRRRLGPQVIVIRPVPDALLFDRREFTVVAGRPVEIVFENVDVMPHNLLVAAPGALSTVGLAAEAMAGEPDAWDKGYVPDLPEVLAATGLLQPGSAATLTFKAPDTPADHPYVCTFPGHWVRMNGVMHVVASYDEVQPAAPLAAPAADAAPQRAFVKAWSPKDFAADLARVDDMSPERGRRVAEQASCLLCHAVGGQGGLTGPPLEEAVARHPDRADLLAQLLDPSGTIAEGYASELIFLRDGDVVAGRILEEDDTTLHVQDDPYSSATRAIAEADIDSRRTSDISAMPDGLLSTWQKDDVLDLLAWLESLRDEG